MSHLQTAVPMCGLHRTHPGKLSHGVRAAILGACSSLGSPHHGAENGPYFIRRIAGAFTWSAVTPAIVHVHRRSLLFQQVVDLGDFEPGRDSIEVYLKSLEALLNLLPPEITPCLIGGDHTITLAAVHSALT